MGPSPAFKIVPTSAAPTAPDANDVASALPEA